MRPGTVFCECICHVMMFFIMKRGICVHRTDVVTFELIVVHEVIWVCPRADPVLARADFGDLA